MENSKASVIFPFGVSDSGGILILMARCDPFDKGLL